uniref:Uncharacterized protein n=1 Tax=Rhizophagus irregularis (strain DAOM 181602 / DAOM 197198 / MUCL 43194) TaxID=747089 RepID=U9UED2_RHIID
MVFEDWNLEELEVSNSFQCSSAHRCCSIVLAYNNSRQTISRQDIFPTTLISIKTNVGQLCRANVLSGKWMSRFCPTSNCTFY